MAQVKGQVDLVDLIDWKSVEVLNGSERNGWANCVKKVRGGPRPNLFPRFSFAASPPPRVPDGRRRA